jgi:hypothetical protein
MSVAILRDSSFGNVLKTLESPSLRDGNDPIDVAGVFGMRSNELRSPEGLDRFHERVRRFVLRCISYNLEARRLRYKEDVAGAPIDLDVLERQGKVVSHAQLFMTLHCIDYNSDVKDYMTRENFKDYILRSDFEEWQCALQQLIGKCAESVAWRKAHEENCEWL